MRPQGVWWSGCRHAPQIHKPSARVSFGLPDPLSFQVRSHAMVARRSGTNTRQGKRQGQAAKQPDPPSWECNAGITKIKAQQGKGEPPARLWLLDTVDGHAQSGQFGCHHSRLWHGSARPSGCPAFLRLAAPKNAATGAAAAAAWSPPRYLISKPHGRGGYAAGKGRCVVFNFSGSFLHRTCIPVNIRISTPGML